MGTKKPSKKKRIAEATHAAVAAVYFADSSDYRSALWEVVNSLNPELATLLAKDSHKAYKRSCKATGREVN